MVESTVEDLKKLPPEERIAKLRELEKKHKQEMEKAGRLLKESMVEARKKEILDKVEVPEQKTVDITDLFKADEETLEGVIGRNVPEKVDEDTVKYELNLDYQILKKAVDELPEYKLQQTLDQVQGRINEMVQKMDYHNMSKDVADQLVATRSVLYGMKKKQGL